MGQQTREQDRALTPALGLEVDVGRSNRSGRWALGLRQVVSFRWKQGWWWQWWAGSAGSVSPACCTHQCWPVGESWYLLHAQQCLPPGEGSIAVLCTHPGVWASSRESPQICSLDLLPNRHLEFPEATQSLSMFVSAFPTLTGVFRCSGSLALVLVTGGHL